MDNCIRLKKSNCKNCYKCIRHCSVKSIRFSGNQAHIVGNECILCGQCFVVCPQNAKEIVSEIENVKIMLMDNAPVVASIAPSFAANYGTGITSMRKALKKLGFADAEETAIGATIVKKEYERIMREQKPNILITSCCHSANLLIQKYFPELLPFLADVLSPMQAHCADVKRRIPNAKTVFIGPCVAKKDEAAHYSGYADAVLTFEELTQWLSDENITLEKEPDAEKSGRAGIFPTAGGIIKSLTERADGYTYMEIDGTENCITALNDIKQGGLNRCFIEMSACAGSCIGGPVMEKYHRSPVRDFASVAEYVGEKDFDVPQLDKSDMHKQIDYIELRREIPGENQIKEILRKMGKTKPEDELNCGSCGYNTCREKAAAIYQGKADLTMCLPFLKDKAESFSDNIIRSTPNGFVVLNENLEVQQINEAACRIMNIRSASDVLGEPVVRILDPKPFLDVMDSGTEIRDKHTFLAEYGRYIEQTVVYDREYRILICIMRDITAEEKEHEHKEEISRQTVEIADKVVDKQMRIVQEIASLLGETAAETKVALSKLKESIKNE